MPTERPLTLDELRAAYEAARAWPVGTDGLRFRAPTGET